MTKKLPLWLILVIIFASIVVISLLIFLIVWYRDKHKSSGPGPEREKYFGTWYSNFCNSVACGQPESSDDKNLLTMDMMIEIAKENKTFPQDAQVNTAASLGPGANLTGIAGGCSKSNTSDYENCKKFVTGNNTYLLTWKDQSCPIPDSMRYACNKNTCKHNILNYGGWGALCGISRLTNSTTNCADNTIPRSIWCNTDIAEIENNYIAIAAKAKSLGYTAISFDLEALSGPWVTKSKDPDMQAAINVAQENGKSISETFNQTAFENAVGRLNKLIPVWIVIPGFNVKPQFGGPLTIKNPSNITMVQLMIYGLGLDSATAGDPGANAKPLTPGIVTKSLTGPELSSVPANMKMMAFSFTTSEKDKELFKEQIDVNWKNASGGLFVWCVKAGLTWTWWTDEQNIHPVSGTCQVGGPPFPTGCCGKGQTWNGKNCV